MQRETTFKLLVPLSVLSVVAQQSPGQPSPQVCAANGGPEICVRFDNFANAPQLDFDMTFDVSDPNNPSVVLLRGDDGFGAMYQWRVWSKNGPIAGDIGSITATADFDFDVTLLNPDDTIAAVNVAEINLTPSDPTNYSRLSGWITGDLAGSLTLQQASGGNGGDLALILVGDVPTGSTITAPVVKLLRIEGKVEGSVILGRITFGADKLTVLGGLSGLVEITDSLTAGFVTIVGKVESTALIKIAFDTTAGGGHVLISSNSSDDTFDGDVFLTNGVPVGQTFQILQSDTFSETTVDLNGQDLAGFLYLDGGKGHVVNVNTVTGMLVLSSGTVQVPDPFEGEVNVVAIGPNGSIELLGEADLEGVINVQGDVYPGGAIIVEATIDGPIPPLNPAKINIGNNLGGSITGGMGLAEQIVIAIGGSIEDTALVDLATLAGEVVYDHDADGIGDWLGTVQVGGASLTPACYWQDASIGGGSIYSGLQALFDCNTNGAPDTCDIDGASSADCDTNGEPDDCLLADADLDGDVDLQDFGAFGACFNTTDELCLAAFDRALDCGAAIDLPDFGVFAGQLTGPLAGGGELAMGGDGASGGDALGLPEGESGAGQAESPPPEQPPADQPSWTIEFAGASLEVRVPGGDTAVTTLAPDTTYELHYSANVDSVSGYVLFAVASEPNEGIAAAAAASQGSWSTTGNFAYVNLAESGSAIAVPGYPDGYSRFQMVTDDAQSLEEAPGSDGCLCTFTTASSGELNLHLVLFSVDYASFNVVEMTAQATFVVEP